MTGASIPRFAAPDRIDGAGTIGGHIAVVHGRGALILSTILTGSLRNGLTLPRLLCDMGLSPADQRDALRAALALEEAGDTWRRSQLPARGTAETRGTISDLPSEPMVDTATASVLLGCGARRVRQLAAAGDLRGTKGTRGWRFLRREVIGLRERREAGED